MWSQAELRNLRSELWVMGLVVLATVGAAGALAAMRVMKVL
jgi:hypothetical protein